MKILYVDLEREWRGGQSQALLTLCGLRDTGHSVELLAAKDSPLTDRVEAAGIAVHAVERLGLRAWAAQAIGRLTARGRYRLVHLNEPHALTAAWLAGAQRYLPLLLSRRIGFPLRKNWISQARYRAVERFVANSKDVAKSLTDSGIAAERISIVNEGVKIPAPVPAEERKAARAAWGVRQDEFLFGCASVFVPEKGQRHLVEAMPRVRARFPKVKLLLAGEGRCLKEVMLQAERFGVRDAVVFPGFVTEMEQFYAALDAFVFPSEFEGLGTALQAAMAHGLASISTARGALGEVVENERTALVVEPSWQEFAAAMTRLVENGALRDSLATAGREEVIRRFSAESMVGNTIAVYEDVLKKRKGA